MKYLSIKINEKRNWKQQISDIPVELNRENAILSTFRHLGRKTLKSIYHVIFKHRLCYSLLVLTQNLNLLKIIFVLQEKSLRIIYFGSRNSHTSLLFRESNILKLSDKISSEDCLFKQTKKKNISTNFYLRSLNVALLFHLVLMHTVLLSPIQTALLYLPITLSQYQCYIHMKLF